MKDTLKRLTCMLLALIMVAGMFPVSVFADAETPIGAGEENTVSSNVISPLGSPAASDASQPLAEGDGDGTGEEGAGQASEAPAFDPAEPINYQIPSSETFSLLKVLADAGAPVNTLTALTGETVGKIDATPVTGDWRLTPYAFFDSLKLSVTAKNYPDGEDAVYTVILTYPDPNIDPLAPAAIRLMDASGSLLAADASSVDDTIKTTAEDLYGGDGTHNPMVSVNITPSFSGTSLAGDLVEYTISYTYRVIDSWMNSNEEWVQYFRSFYDNKVIIHLPAGLLMPAQSPVEASFELDPNDPTNTDLTKDHYYTINLNVLDPAVGPEPIDPQGSTLNGDFTIKVYIGNNGTADSINTYNLPADLVTLSTKFDILGEDGVTKLATYEHQDTETTGPVVTASPDEWKLSKVGVPAETKLSADGKSVTFTWDIEVGLKELNESGTATSSIATLDDKYGRKGRDLLESMTLTDLFSTVLSLNTTDVTDQATKVTIKKAIATAWGTEVPLTNNSPILIWDGDPNSTAVNANLMMNSGNLVDTDGDGDLDQLTAKYTKYRVTVTYPVKDPDWIAQFPDAAAYTLNETNTATIQPVLAKKPHDPVSASAEQTVTLPVAGASTLLISKLFTDYNSHEAAYDDQYGVIQFEIKSDNNFTVYDANGSAMKDDAGVDMSGKNSYVLKKGVTYYLAPGIAYTVKENLTDDQKNAMTQTDNPTDFTNTPVAGKPWNVTFHNKETVGKITVTKKDDAGRLMTSANMQPGGDVIGFTLEKQNADGTWETVKYKDASGAEKTERFINSNGTVTFERLPYGNYRISETTTPVGYATMNPNPYTFSVSAAENNISYTAVNKVSTSRFMLTKYVGKTEANITTPATPAFPGTFKIQRTATVGADGKPVENTFTDVTSDAYNKPLSTTLPIADANGRLYVDLPAFDSEGKEYYYRFVEAIPDGYYDPANSEATTAYSEAKTLTETKTIDGQETVVARPLSDPAQVTMYNRQAVDIRLNKDFYKITSDGKTSSRDDEKSTYVTLWKTTDDPATNSNPSLTRVKAENEVDNGQKVSRSDYANWSSLPMYDANGNRIHYLVKETPVNGYFLDEYGQYEGSSVENSKKLSRYTIGGAVYVEIPFESTDGTENLTLANRSKAYPAIIWKRNANNGNPVVSDSTKYVKVTIWKVKTVDGVDQLDGVAVDARDGTSKYENVTIQTTNGSGSYFYLEHGQKYVFQEVENTTGMSFDSYRYGSTSTVPIPAENEKRETTIGGETYGVIDLTDYTQTFANRDSAKNATRTVYNKDEPNVRIKKVDSASTSTVLAAAKFKVYTYNAETGKYDPYPNADNQVEITTTSPASNSGVRLEAGKTFYFAESESPSGYLNPNDEATYNSYYASESAYKRGQTTDGQWMTFYEKTIVGTQETSPKDLVCEIVFKNVKNAGGLKVLKYLDGTLANGYEIVIKDSEGNEVASAVTAGTGANAGTATFTNIPVYDASGKKIEYTVTEELSEDQAESVTKASDDQKVTLILGQTVTKAGNTPNTAGTDNTGDALAVYNTKRISFSGTKVFRKAFEYSYTNFEMPVEGAVIGLFIKNKTTGNWDLVEADKLSGPTDSQGQVTNPATTDNKGGVTFSGLIRGEDYVMVELSSGDGNDYMFPYPFTLEYPSQGVATTSISDADISKYNTISLSGTTTKDSTATAFPAKEEKMINSNHWVQFDITKWLDPRIDTDEQGNMHTHHAPANVSVTRNPDGTGKMLDGGEEVTVTPVDNVIFKLYRYIMPEGVTSVDFPKAYVDGEGWDLVGQTGTYTTGTLYVNNVRQSGEFITDSDQNINNRYVYMLVEEDVGPNSVVMNPNFKYTFWHAENTGYTVSLTGEAAGYTARNNTYKIDTVNKDNIIDSSPVGPGAVLYYLASVRIAKYQDSYNEKTGDPNKDYQPLYGATFTLSLSDGTVIDTMTVGLDSQLSGPEGLSLAQSGTFQLILPHTGDNDTDNYILEDFANEKEYELTDVRPFSFEQDGKTFQGYRLPVKLTETVVPDGYNSFLTGGLDMWLCFVNVVRPTVIDGQEVYQGESWVFNDAYFVLTTGTNTTEVLADNQSAISWYVTNASSKDYTVAVGDTENPSKLRIVNYPTTNTPVRLVKYGYTPTATTVANGGMTAAQLDAQSDAAINRVPLQNVQMVIQVKDGSSWKYWNYKTDATASAASAATFTTDEHGMFSFPHGLPEGTYRIYETAIGSGNEAYENAYPSSRAREFTVTKAVVDLSFYNPVKVDMKMVKQDMDGAALTDAVFQLKSNGTVVATADKDNNYTFSNVASGTYVLSEAREGYSSAYLEKYLKATYSGLEAIVGTGAAIGYTYSQTGHTGEFVVSAINPSALTPAAPDDPTADASPVFTLTVKNPKLTEVKLRKADEQKSETALSGATFVVYYLPFSALSGDITVNIPAAGSSASATTTNFTNAGWSRVGGSSKTYTTNKDGIIILSEGADPGIYAFYETGAPAGYDIIKDKDGKAIIYTAVVTGGIPVNVTVNPNVATVIDYSGTAPTEKSVTTSWQSTDGTTVQVEVSNRAAVQLKAKKTINSGELKLGSSDAWSITLNLYSDEARTKKVGTVVITNRTDQEDLYFMVPAANGTPSTNKANLSLGSTYYLEEVITAPTDQFELGSILKDGTKMTEVTIEQSEKDGKTVAVVTPGFELTEVNGFTITAVNNWLYGEVTFEKRDAKDAVKLLSGAEFKNVQYKKVTTAADGTVTEEWVHLDDEENIVSEIMNGDHGTGKYVARIPLVSGEATTYRIYETKAPVAGEGDPYLLDKTKYIEVTLSIDDNVKEESLGLNMTNTTGDELTVMKFDNLQEAERRYVDTSKETKFAVYHKVDDQWVLDSDFEGYTNEGGAFTVVTVPGDFYAIAETSFNTAKYNSLEGMYLEEMNEAGEVIREIPLQVEKITAAGGKEIDLYVLPSAMSRSVQVRAYNVPNIQPIIRKIDVGQYLGGEGIAYPKTDIQARMNYAIYEITQDDAALYALTGDAQPTRAQVEAFLATKTSADIVTSGSTGSYDASVLLNGTSAVWNAESAEKRWNNTKSYLIVETNVTANGGTYDTMRKDDPRVVWFYKTSPVSNPDPENPPVWTLKNIYGDAAVKLEKEAVIGGDDNDIFADTENSSRATIDSLLPDSRKVVFTVTPEVSGHNQMLDAFILKEQGITAKGITGVKEDGTAVIGDVDAAYTFTKIEIGSASHEVNTDFGIGATPRIDALVTFYSTAAMAETDIISSVTVEDLSSNRQITSIPDGTKAFAVSYYSGAVRTATAAMCDKTYSLGENFMVTPTTVYATMTQIADGTSDSPAKEITQITNHSRVDLDYWKWSESGVMGDEPVRKDGTADADVYVKSIAIPKVKIVKTRQSSVTSLNSEVYYTITVSNSGDSETAFVNPIVLDILPTAVSYVAGSAPTSVQSSDGTNFTVAAQVIAGSDSSASSNGTVVTEKENAILFKLTGNLAPGASVNIPYRANVSRSSELFADVVGGAKLLCNDVYLTSAETGYHTASNKNGWPFTDENNQYGKPLSDAAASLNNSPSATRREGQMEGSLKTDGVDYADGDQFVWLSNTIDVSLNKQSRVRLVKAVWADRDDGGWHDEKLGVASRTNGRFGTEGWVRWRLAVTNGYSDRNVEGLVLGDVIPRPGDGENRQSQWTLNFDKILVVENNGVSVDPSLYTVYYYTGATANAEAALKNALTQGAYAENGFVLASSVADPTTVTAFIVVFNFNPADATKNVVLVPGASLILTYETKVIDVQDDTEFAEIAFRNDTNYFFFYYRNVSEPMQSNKVQVTLTDVPVEIQGDLWIDEDWDGVQEQEDNKRNYSGYKIVQMLADAMSFTITDNRAGAMVTHPSSDSGDMSQWKGGESIKHFRFDNLGAATTKLGVDYPYSGESLNVSDLKGDDPYNYTLNAVLSNTDLLDIFALSPLGGGGGQHFISDNPDSDGFKNHTAANFLDNNFYAGNALGSYTTRPYYIRYSENIDQSKDIGFIMKRDLEITKVAQDDSSVLIPNAEFRIYGPFKENEGTAVSGSPLTFTKAADGSYALDSNGTITALKTDAAGKIKVTGLNWWKEYVIEEVKAGDGYRITGAEAKASGGTVITDLGNGVFTLKLPSQDKVTKQEFVTVENPRGVSDVPFVKKTVQGTPLKDETFKFTLAFASDMDQTLANSVKFKNADTGKYEIFTPPQTKILTLAAGENPSKTEAFFDVDGTIKLWFLRPGTYKFVIKEVKESSTNYDPAAGTGSWGKDATITYDESEWSYVVNVELDDTNGLKATHTYTKIGSDPTETAEQAEFVNKYAAQPVHAHLSVKKIIEGTPAADLDDAVFKFTLAPVGDAPLTKKTTTDGVQTETPTDPTVVTITATEAASGTVKNFGDITFDKIGTYQYTITETDDSATYPWFAFSTAPVTATVKIVDDPQNPGNLKVESITYTVGTAAAEITNTYAEGDWTPYIKKVLEGRVLEDDEFNFTVTDTTDADNPVKIADGVAKADGSVVLTYVEQGATGVTYTLADLGTHTYVIHEVETEAQDSDNNGIPDDGISKHAPDKTVTVTVEKNPDNPTRLKVTESPASSANNPHLMTNTYEAKGSWTPKALKILNGRALKEGEFTFVLEKGTKENDVISYSTVKTATNKADGTVDFNTTFNYTQDDVGTYYYRISEQTGTLPLVEFDTNAYEITVTVSAVKGSDKLKVEVSPDDTAPYKFTNTYNHEPIPHTIPVEKKISDNIPPALETFKFTLNLTSDNANNVKTKDEDGNFVDFAAQEKELTLGTDSSASPATVVLNGSTAFDELWFLNEGVYTFEVSEKLPSSLTPGFTYSQVVYVVTVNVSKDANTGVLSKKVTTVVKDTETATEIVFDNKYHTEPVEYPVQVRKKLTGEALYDAENTIFTFKLSDENGKCNPKDGYEMPDTLTIEIPGDEVEAGAPNGATAVFKNIKFVKAGEYYFIVEELRGTNPKVTYDPAKWEVKIVVKDSVVGGVAKLEVVKPVQYTSLLNSADTSTTEAIFSNDYNPDDTNFPPKVTKVLEGIDYEGRTSEVFYFQLTETSDPNNGATLASPTSVSVTDQGTTNFGQIQFTKSGDYEFQIVETVTDRKTGYTYNTNPWTLLVTIADNNGALYVKSYSYSSDTQTGESAQADEAAVIAEAVKGAVITNEYKPIPVTYIPPAGKTIKTDFGPTVASKTFEFELLALSGPSNGQYYTNGAGTQTYINSGTKLTKSLEIPAGTTTGNITFDTITYEKKGVYTYQITEKVPADPDKEKGIDYSTSTWKLTVTIENNAGTLEVSSAIYELLNRSYSEPTFENTYKPEPVEFTPKATKTIEAEFGPTVASKIFNFDLKLESALAADGTTDVKDGADVQSETKTVTVAAGETVESVLFSKITFSKAGKYTYSITEQESKEEGITDDTETKTLVIEVKDKDGALYISKYTYSTGETKSAGPNDTPLTGLEEDSVGNAVTNVYVPTPTKYPPQVTKTLRVDYGPTVAEKIFTFTLENVSALAADGTTDVTDGQVQSDTKTPYDFAAATKEITVPAGETVGTVTFDDIWYTKAGTYTYKITEQASREEGITDDTAEWTLTVVVTDMDGYLEVTGTDYTSSDAAAPGSDSTVTFINTYKPEPTEYTPQVNKNIELVTGAPTSLDKHFIFDLAFVSAVAKDGFTDVSDGQLDAAEDAGGMQFAGDTVTITIPAGEVTVGPASFGTIHFTKAGTYTYMITERMDTELGMIYDVATWTLTVVVDDTDGKLEITETNATYKSSLDVSTNHKAAEFVNPYATGKLRVEKRVSGSGASVSTKFNFNVYLYTENFATGTREPLAGEYPVVIYDKKGNVIGTATVQNGTVSFKLRHSEYAVISGIPVGVKWEVIEEKYIGYASSAENPNYGTIGLTDSVSKWKNHRSTVPPIPRTGYGDGTTVKVGLGASLGVFLASAIGTVLQSRGTKKKKRGGSHAAE